MKKFSAMLLFLFLWGLVALTATPDSILDEGGFTLQEILNVDISGIGLIPTVQEIHYTGGEIFKEVVQVFPYNIKTGIVTIRYLRYRLDNDKAVLKYSSNVIFEESVFLRCS